MSTYQILKLKLGPQDSSGIIEIYINGINSPLSVLWRRSNVSGMLSFLSPLYASTNSNGKKIKHNNKLSQQQLDNLILHGNVLNNTRRIGREKKWRTQWKKNRKSYSYPSNSKSICSSSRPPTTLNFRKLHTCVFSYFPNLIFFTIAGRCSFSVKNCGGVFVFDDHRDTWLLGQSSRIFLFASKIKSKREIEREKNRQILYRQNKNKSNFIRCDIWQINKINKQYDG